MAKSKKPQYERAGYLEISKVFPHIEKHLKEEERIRVQIDEFYVNVSSLRLKSFVVNGVACSCCSVKASFFAIERTNGSQSPFHLNLYGVNDSGEEILFTHDHIQARGLGGTDTLNNTRTSCGPCNWRKGELENLIKKSTDEKETARLYKKLNKFLEKISPLSKEV